MDGPGGRHYPQILPSHGRVVGRATIAYFSRSPLSLSPMEPSAVFSPFPILPLPPLVSSLLRLPTHARLCRHVAHGHRLRPDGRALLHDAQGLWHHPVRDVHKGCPAGENVSWLIPVAPLRPLHHQLRACYTNPLVKFFCQPYLGMQAASVRAASMRVCPPADVCAI